MHRHVAPYGSWKSPITAQAYTSRSIVLSQLRVDGNDIYWVEAHPLREGRNVLLRHNSFGQTSEILPLLEGSKLVHVNTRVHEYGGRAYAVKNGIIVVSDGSDDRAYAYNTNDPQGQLIPLTSLDSCRYGDFEIDDLRGLVYAIREDHSVPGSPVNSLVSIPLDGSAARDESRIKTLFAGTDFVSSPTLSYDGARLAWITWNLPNMPWTKSELQVGALNPEGELDAATTLVDRAGVCVYEPRWTLDGDLIHVDDSTGWANMYRTENFTTRPGEPVDAWTMRLRTRALHPGSAAFSQPHWRLGLHSYDNLDHEHLICSWTENSQWHIGTMRLENGMLEEWNTGWAPCGNVAAADGRVVYLGQSATKTPTIITVKGTTVSAIRSTSYDVISEDYVSEPKLLDWAAADGTTIHGFYYEPRNPDYAGEESELPPLIVRAHPGPTAASRIGLDLTCQYFTTRGFAVLDVNYRGSTGYGRDYRSALNGQYGILDASDCADGALFLINQKLVDPSRVSIVGSSSGGFTAMSALIRSDVFSAGVSLNGFSDLKDLHQEGHKFLAHYTEILLNSDNLDDDVWESRSPINNLEQLHAPLLLIQGEKDPVAPPSQTVRLYDELVRMGKPVSMVLLADEGHGFSKAESIETTWRAQLTFYGKVWGIDVDRPIELPIANTP